jgi:hypothetical protein
MEDIQIIYRGEPITLRFFNYNNGRTGILMLHAKDGSFWGPATVNLDCNIPNSEIIVKDYGDSATGLYDVLLKNEIVEPYRRTMDIGGNKAKVCKLHPRIK